MKNPVNISIQIPEQVKGFYERRAESLMVSMSAVIRSVLADHANKEQKRSAKKEGASK